MPFRRRCLSQGGHPNTINFVDRALLSVTNDGYALRGFSVGRADNSLRGYSGRLLVCLAGIEAPVSSKHTPGPEHVFGTHLTRNIHNNEIHLVVRLDTGASVTMKRVFADVEAYIPCQWIMLFDLLMTRALLAGSHRCSFLRNCFGKPFILIRINI